MLSFRNDQYTIIVIYSWSSEVIFIWRLWWWRWRLILRYFYISSDCKVGNLLSNSKHKKSDKTYQELREPNLYLFSQTQSWSLRNIWNLKVKLSIKYFGLGIRNVWAQSFPLVMEILWSICLTEEREIFCWTAEL